MGVTRQLGLLPYLRVSLKLRVRSWAHPKATQAWLELLNSHPAFADYVSRSPRMLYKIYRPYMTLHLPIHARLAVLGAHYRFMFDRGLDQLVASAASRPLPLAAVEGRDGARYDVALQAIGLLEREGELVLQLREEAVPAYSVAFTFAQRDGKFVVNIGCIQGKAHDGAREAIRTATRQLHGARPKQLLVAVIRCLGHALGCHDMRLASNANRVVRSAIRNGTVHADYDQLWTDMGAARLADGDYHRPCQPLCPPDFDAAPSKKRAELRRRHLMLDAICSTVAAQFGCGATPSALPGLALPAAVRE